MILWIAGIIARFYSNLWTTSKVSEHLHKVDF